MALLLTEKDVDELIDMKTTVTCLEKVFREQSAGRFLLPDRQVIQESGSPAVVRLMGASISNLGALGLKVLLGSAGKRKDDSVYFVVLLFDKEDAHLLAMISAARLTVLRTGAASAVATRYLARHDSSTVGVIGAGVQGFGQLEGVAAVTQVKRGLVFDVVGEKSNTFVRSANSKLGLEMRSTTKLDDIYDMDIICSATTSTTPIIFGDRIRTGTHINAVGSNLPTRRELDEKTLQISKIFVDLKEQVLKESGDLLVPTKNGSVNGKAIAGELCDVVAGKIRGRNSDSDITLFKSVGIALEDIAVARAVYERALSHGRGQEMSV